MCCCGLGMRHAGEVPLFDASESAGVWLLLQVEVEKR